MGKKITGFSLDEGIAEKVRVLAKEQKRTLSNYVNIVLIEHLKKKGVSTAPPKKKLNRRKR